MADVLGFFKKVAPWVANAAASTLPGPIGMAAKIVSDAIGKSVKANPDDIAAAVAGATPEQLQALRAADQQFQVDMKKLGFENEEDMAKIAAEDRANARDRENKVRDKTPRILAYIYAAGFFATLGAVIWIAVSGMQVNELVMKSVDVLLGVEVGMVLGSKEYFFGSSSGSEHKNDIISSLSK